MNFIDDGEPTSGARTLRFDDVAMWVELDDGATLRVEYTRYPRLLNATPEQRLNYWIGYEGQGLHWDEIDEDISVPYLLARDRELRSERANMVAAE